jgi:hypothetical protein
MAHASLFVRRRGHQHLIDLAGSEKAGPTTTQGVRRTEGAYINKSLLTLGNVISKLSKGSGYVSQLE